MPGGSARRKTGKKRTKEPVTIVCANRHIDGVKKLASEAVAPFVKRMGKRPGILLAQEFAPTDLFAVPPHSRVKEHIRSIQHHLRGSPNLRVVFAAREKGHRGYPHIVAYCVSRDGYQMALKRAVSRGDREAIERIGTLEAGSKVRGKRMEKFDARNPEHLTFPFEGRRFIVRPCRDGAELGGKEGHIMLVPADGLPDMMKMAGSEIAVVTDPSVYGPRLEFRRMDDGEHSGIRLNNTGAKNQELDDVLEKHGVNVELLHDD